MKVNFITEDVCEKLVSIRIGFIYSQRLFFVMKWLYKRLIERIWELII
jgi:hypothetical protein